MRRLPGEPEWEGSQICRESRQAAEGKPLPLPRASLLNPSDARPRREFPAISWPAPSSCGGQRPETCGADGVLASHRSGFDGFNLLSTVFYPGSLCAKLRGSRMRSPMLINFQYRIGIPCSLSLVLLACASTASLNADLQTRGDEQRQLDAAASLGKKRSESAALCLTTAFDDPSPRVRQAVTAALIDIGIPAYDPLIEALVEGRSALARQEAARTLVTIGRPVVESLLKWFPSKKHPANIPWVLGEIGDTRAIRPLIEQFTSVDGEVEIGYFALHSPEEAQKRVTDSAWPKIREKQELLAESTRSIVYRVVGSRPPVEPTPMQIFCVRNLSYSQNGMQRPEVVDCSEPGAFPVRDISSSSPGRPGYTRIEYRYYVAAESLGRISQADLGADRFDKSRWLQWLKTSGF